MITGMEYGRLIDSNPHSNYAQVAKEREAKESQVTASPQFISVSYSLSVQA